MKGLTAKQHRVLEVIRRHLRQRGQPPTVREIGQEIGVASSCTVQRHLDALERKGYIRRHRYKYRSIELTDSSLPSFVWAVNVPVLGQIAAGQPIFAQQEIEDAIPLPVEMVGEGDQVFMLRVKGDSMIGAGIHDGDLVAVRMQPTVQNGEIVAALLGDEATVKRFYRSGNRVQLISENPAYPPIEPEPETFRILGKVILSLRRYH